MYILFWSWKYENTDVKKVGYFSKIEEIFDLTALTAQMAQTFKSVLWIWQMTYLGIIYLGIHIMQFK